MYFNDMMEQMGVDAAAEALGLDAINLAVKCNHYVKNQTFNVRIETAAGHSGRLRISRYYWSLDEPVAVDFIRDIHFGITEIATKKAFFKTQGIQYVFVKDDLDGDGVERALAALTPEPDAVAAIRNAAKPLLGPRRNANV